MNTPRFASIAILLLFFIQQPATTTAQDRQFPQQTDLPDAKQSESSTKDATREPRPNRKAVLAELKAINARLERIERMLEQQSTQTHQPEEHPAAVTETKPTKLESTVAEGVTLMHAIPIRRLVPGAAVSLGNGEHRFSAIPEELLGRNFTAREGYQGNLKFRIDTAQTVFVAIYGKEWGEGGNPSGNWQPELVSREQLIEQGWKQTDLLPVSHSNPEYKDEPAWIVFRRACQAGETFLIRTHKYQAPILIWGPQQIPNE
jgi:hypothetical protein